MDFIGLISPVILAFTIERIWNVFQRKKSLNDLKNRVMNEIDINLMDGVGFKVSPFHIAEHIEVLNAKCLDGQSLDLIKRIIHLAKLCNADLYSAGPREVKKLSQSFKSQLQIMKPRGLFYKQLS